MKLSGSSQQRNTNDTNVNESFLINNLDYKSNSFFSSFWSCFKLSMLEFEEFFKKRRKIQVFINEDTQSENFSCFYFHILLSL